MRVKREKAGRRESASNTRSRGGGPAEWIKRSNNEKMELLVKWIENTEPKGGMRSRTRKSRQLTIIIGRSLASTR